MTDVEKFEYKSQKKPIKFGSNYLGISTNNGLKCIVSCINLPNDIVNQKGVLRFSWNFNWNALKKRGIDRLSGYIVVLYEKTSRYQIMEGVKFDVDLKEPNQFIEKLIKTSVLNYDHHAMFEYSLVPHYTQIKEINEESMLMFTPSEQNDAILMVEGKKIHVNKVFLSCHSEFFRALFSSNHQEGKMNEIPIEEISYDDFKLLLGSISPNTVFPTDETVEKLLEMAHRFMMPSVIRHVEYYLLQISDIENEKKMLIGEKYGMTDLLEKSILKIDTAEKVTKWMKSPEYSKLSAFQRSQETEKEKAARKRKNNEMTATARSQESDEMTEKRRKSVALRTASRRSEEPSESRDNRNRSNANRTASRRSEEPDDVKQQRIRDNTIRTAATRASESVTLTLARRSADRSRKASRPSAFLGIAASGVHPDVHYFGRMNKRCAHCGALYFEEEATTKGEYTACCITGAVKLEIKKNFPSALMKLFMRTDSESKNFKQNIRQYNNSLAMACLMASIDVPQGKGPYSLKLHKQVYHLIGDLHPVQGVKESFAQIFIIDTEQAAAELAGRELNNNCSEAFFQKFF